MIRIKNWEHLQTMVKIKTFLLPSLNKLTKPFLHFLLKANLVSAYNEIFFSEYRLIDRYLKITSAIF